MKHFIALLLALVAIQLVWAQSGVPHSFSYQAVARDNTGTCLMDENLTVRLSILNGPGGNSFYSERHSVQTNSVGHFQVTVGEGVGQSGSLDPQSWLGDPYLKIELAPGFNQSSGFSTVGETPLRSVPYALTAGNGTFVNSVESDSLSFFGPSGNLNVLINSSGSSPNNGLISVANALGVTKGSLSINSNGEGTLNLNNDQGNSTFSAFADGPGNGALFIRGTDNQTAMLLSYDVNNNPVIQMFRNTGNPNTSGGASMFVNAAGDGGFACSGPNGGVKHFVMPHPEMPGKEIWYASIEGPEAAAYERGTAELVNGEAEIVFPEHFQIVANPTSMTISTSPWSAESKGLAVIERTETGFKVKELFDGKGTYKFDWRVEAKRKGHENYQVIRDNQESPIRPRAINED